MILKTWSRSILPTLLLMAMPAFALAQVSVDVSVNVAPPELPVYDQPPIPSDGYLWTPGYWAWSDDDEDYYWVPGTWVMAPEPGYLWTPGYWGAAGALFLWHAGYWGPRVGFYGGVDYGYGYGGEGYQGGYWRGGHMYYNRSVNNITTTHITNVYNRTVINNVTVNRVSYNGGTGGVRDRPSAADQAAAHERHFAATSVQYEHEQTARRMPELRESANRGHPPIAATERPGAFSGAGVVAAKHAGTMSVIHSPSRPHEAQPSREQAQPREQRAPPRDQAQPREPAPREQPQPREPAPREQQQPREPAPREQQQPPQNERQSRPAQQQQRPTQQPRPEDHSRAAERPPQHQEADHEHH